MIAVQGGHLKSGHTLSCGCYQKSVASKANRSHGMSKSRLYRIYRHMKERCYNPTCKAYEDYGGRGIQMCQEWLGSFYNFNDWAVSNGYSDTFSIDRINNSEGYSPDNCRWTSDQQQCNNRRSNVFLEYCGEYKTLAEWARNMDIKYSSLLSRWHKGLKPPELFRDTEKGSYKYASV